jgi:hypothetical protein
VAVKLPEKMTFEFCLECGATLGAWGDLCSFRCKYDGEAGPRPILVQEYVKSGDPVSHLHSKRGETKPPGAADHGKA